MRKISLTYDDGPNTPFTLDILDVLAKYDVKATFFMVGRFVQERPDIAQEVADNGHLIGNHTINHPKLTEMSIDRAREEIQGCERILTEVVGSHSGLFRPPFVLTSQAVEDIVVSLGLTSVMWKAAGSDWMMRGVDAIVNKVVQEIQDGSGIVLLHDGFHEAMGGPRADTVTATDILIRRFKDEGCEFVQPLELDMKETPKWWSWA
jgi:peptidoglycan/xylan/chitin deacetylase (PgdA/CDA1 family)